MICEIKFSKQKVNHKQSGNVWPKYFALVTGAAASLMLLFGIHSTFLL